MRSNRVAGLVLSLAVGAVCMGIARLIPGFSALIVAVVLGMIASSAGLTRFKAVSGMRSSAKRVLRLGIVLLGFQVTFAAVADLGVMVLALIAVSSGVTFAATLAMSRFFKVTRSSAYLMATGVSICGASAIAAMGTVVRRHPDDETDPDTEMAESIAIITLLGTILMFALPAFGSTVLGMSDRAFGLWAGLSVHEVAQVVAAGSAVSALALSVATVTKLARVLLLAPLVAGVGYSESKGALPTEGNGESGSPASRVPIVPLFILGFLGAVAVRNLTDLPTIAIDLLALLSTLLLTSAMFAIGTTVNVHKLVKTGGPLLALGAASTAVLLAVSFFGLLVVGEL